MNMYATAQQQNYRYCGAVVDVANGSDVDETSNEPAFSSTHSTYFHIRRPACDPLTHAAPRVPSERA